MFCHECNKEVGDITQHISNGVCNLTIKRLMDVGYITISDLYSQAIVEDIEEIEYDQDVYDIEVQHNHNYTANGHLVHNCNTLTLEGLFGKVYKVTTTHQLQTEGKLAGLKLKALMLKYPDEDRKALMLQKTPDNKRKKLEYKDEITFLITHQKRNRFIRNLALSCVGNTLVMFNFVETHGLVLFNMIKEKITDRPIYFIHGGVDVNEREKIRNKLATDNNAIVVCSYGTLSTGINIPSIENIIFSSPSKSTIRVLQSLGRGLRLNEGKTHCKLFDITDDLHWKSSKNHTLKHGAERYQIYMSEQFEIKLIEVDL